MLDKNNTILDKNSTQKHMLVQAVELSDAEMEKVSGGGCHCKRHKRKCKYWY